MVTDALNSDVVRAQGVGISQSAPTMWLARILPRHYLASLVDCRTPIRNTRLRGSQPEASPIMTASGRATLATWSLANTSIRLRACHVAKYDVLEPFTAFGLE
jgi:hypothetical protein